MKFLCSFLILPLLLLVFSWISGYFLLIFENNDNHAGLTGFADTIAKAEPLFNELNSPASFGSPDYDDNVLLLANNSLNRTTNQFVIGSEDWHIEDSKSDTLSTSLRLDIKKGNTTNWSTVSTDFIPVIADTFYNYSLNISARDVNQLHSKVYYYDSNKTEIDSKFVFGGRDGTFNNTFTNIFDTPINASYLKMQLWVRPNPENDSYYVLVSNKTNNIAEPVEFKFNNADTRNQRLAANFKSEIVFKSNRFLTSMSFLGNDDLLVLEKNSGKVQRIINGQMLDEPILDVDVASEFERGLLGMAIKGDGVRNPVNKSNPISVFLFFTESRKDNSDDCPDPNYCKSDGYPLGNRLYRYEFADGKLINPELILNIPSSTHSVHVGGTLRIGEDGYVYLTSGDGSFGNISSAFGDNNILDVLSSNEQNGSKMVGRGGILKISTNGTTSESGIIGSSYPLNLYYAYGIRSSFGIDFDPVTGNLWDTENGPIYGDEINLVAPGFNSGWHKVQGIWYNNGFVNGTRAADQPDGLVDFNGNGSYSSPEFVWYRPSVAPTALIFLDSDKYGKEFENDMLVGDYRNGKIYHFDLNHDRTALSLEGPLKDGIADSPDELRNVTFGRYFEGITDMDLGPDGYLYVLSHYGASGDYHEEGISIIYRLVPKVTLDRG